MMQTDHPTTHHPEHERQQIHDFFIKQNYIRFIRPVVR